MSPLDRATLDKELPPNPSLGNSLEHRGFYDAIDATATSHQYTYPALLPNPLPTIAVTSPVVGQSATPEHGFHKTPSLRSMSSGSSIPSPLVARARALATARVTALRGGQPVEESMRDFDRQLQSPTGERRSTRSPIPRQTRTSSLRAELNKQPSRIPAIVGSTTSGTLRHVPDLMESSPRRLVSGTMAVNRARYAGLNQTHQSPTLGGSGQSAESSGTTRGPTPPSVSSTPAGSPWGASPPLLSSVIPVASSPKLVTDANGAGLSTRQSAYGYRVRAATDIREVLFGEPSSTVSGAESNAAMEKGKGREVPSPADTTPATSSPKSKLPVPRRRLALRQSDVALYQSDRQTSMRVYESEGLPIQGRTYSAPSRPAPTLPRALSSSPASSRSPAPGQEASKMANPSSRSAGPRVSSLLRPTASSSARVSSARIPSRTKGIKKLIGKISRRAIGTTSKTGADGNSPLRSRRSVPSLTTVSAGAGSAVVVGGGSAGDGPSSFSLPNTEEDATHAQGTALLLVATRRFQRMMALADTLPPGELRDRLVLMSARIGGRTLAGGERLEAYLRYRAAVDAELLALSMEVEGVWRGVLDAFGLEE
jgi:hypothetical protein